MVEKLDEIDSIGPTSHTKVSNGESELLSPLHQCTVSKILRTLHAVGQVFCIQFQNGLLGSHPADKVLGASQNIALSLDATLLRVVGVSNSVNIKGAIPLLTLEGNWYVNCVPYGSLCSWAKSLPLALSLCTVLLYVAYCQEIVSCENEPMLSKRPKFMNLMDGGM